MVDFSKIAKKWQKRWEEKGIFKATENSKKKKFYCLEMFPYPSGSGLHMGHVRNYSIGDCLARYKRMQGFNVLYPMGYDSFGLPAENAAIKQKADPNEWTFKNIKLIKNQQKLLGFSYDWTREIATCNEDYYKWNQWIFLKFFEKDIAYRKNAVVNWCPSCKTVLANEQVEDEKCWRCKNEVGERELKQWFFRITKYSDELLEDLDKLENWPKRVRTMQENWIGKSHGVDIFFKLSDSNKIIPTFTTRPDTIHSVTFIVIAPEHPLVLELIKGNKHEKEVLETIKKIKKQSIAERTSPEGKDKIGCCLGKYAVNPANKEKIPIWIANFVIMEYGTGIVMADAHDQRDFEFARKYGIPLRFVISRDGNKIDANKADHAYTEDGILFDSGKFSGMKNREAIQPMSEWLEKNHYGKKSIQYKIRDWLISRQRYWGTPIPVIYCDKCGTVPVPYEDLPVRLPKNVKFTGLGNPLETSEEFVNCKCPKCNGMAIRETDTMDTFVDSSWYFLRYCSPEEIKLPFNKKSAEYWMPVDQYIGGIEHAIMHLLYARFFTKALRDLGLHKFDEPFTKLLCQGMVLKEGEAMSKSKGNVVDPREITDKYGPDTARLFILFAALPENELGWSDKGVNGCFKFLNRVCSLSEKAGKFELDARILNRLHRTIKKITEDIDNFEYNKAIVHLYDYTDYLNKFEKIPNEAFENLLLLLAPFTPHLCEELWSKLGNKNFISLEKWPKFDSKKINDQIDKEETLIEATATDVRNVLKLVKIEPKKVYLYVIPKEKGLFSENKDALEKIIGLEFNIFAVNDKNIYGPQAKIKKAKPGKPAIFVE